MRKFYLSSLSLFPYCLGEGGPGDSISMAEKAGFKGLQIAPARGWKPETVSVLRSEDVIACEGAWNQGSLWGCAKRYLGSALGLGWEGPLLEDWMVFGRRPLTLDQLAALFPTALKIVHFNNQAGFYEINPEGGEPWNEFQWLVMDLHHYLRDYRDGRKNPFPHWAVALSKLQNRIALVHIHPTVQEVQGLLNQDGGEFNSFVRAIGRVLGPNVPMVLEVAPKIGTPAAAINYLSSLREATLQLLGD